jgi:hypothetical protein
MFGPTTTGGAIDTFESRFTSTAVGHFMIAANGKEAYPLSEAESLAFRALYRRRMGRARWIRRIGLFAVIPVLILINTWSDEAPAWLQAILRWVHALTILALPVVAMAQHPITSLLTRAGIERPLKNRMTTRLPAAVTPVTTPLGAFARKMLITAFVIEAAIALVHAFTPRAEVAGHMRVFTGLRSGSESWTAQLTGNIAWYAILAMIVSAILLMIDRRNKRAAARAKAEQAV